MTTRTDELIKRLTARVYLGDGLYASHDGYQIRLAASDGIHDTNEVSLDTSVFQHLVEFKQHCDETIKEINDEQQAALLDGADKSQG